MTATRNFASYCMRCVHVTHPVMLTTYCVRDATCDRCGRIGDLAMITPQVVSQEANV